MNIIKPLTCILAIAFSATAAAKVSLEIPDSVEMLVVNGKKPETSGSIFSSVSSLELKDGEQQIVFRYHPYYSQGSERVGVEGDVVIAKFEADNQSLSFDLPKYRNAAEAEENIHTMQWSLRDEQGNTLNIEQDRLIKEGMQIGRDYKQEAFEYNLSGGDAAVGTAFIKGQSGTSSANDTTAEEMLHFWYNKADAATKARFKAYVNK